MKSLTARRFVPSALLAAALLAVSPAAIAAPPVKGGNPPDFEPNTVVPAGEGCSFPLLLEATGSNANIQDFQRRERCRRPRDHGRPGIHAHIYPPRHKREPGEVIGYPADRPVQQVAVAADGTQTVTATGSNGLILFSTDLPSSAAPSAVQYTGRIVYTIAPNGVFTLLSTSGTRTDICAAWSR